MPCSFEFFYDYTSPTAYIGDYAARGVAERTGAEMIYRPMFLGGVMQATGNRPPGTVEAKAKYMGADVPRCAARYGLSFQFNPAFPLKTLPILRASIALAEEDPVAFATFRDACWARIWGADGPKNLGRSAEIEALCQSIDMDPERILAMGKDDGLKAKLSANTEEAVERGVFGAPTFFVGEDMFFGHDRLDYVEERVA
ncbi:MAG: 2-hydroxychromene-2-carboxylate isomerase [Pseudomonadota bacterium]